ncbi:FG-GAP-like repeat-containing protein [Streptomyces flavidovirens]|uniref:FG-GAP-like repeat-containing protein n=1 Tax=Streptomyces flavidovirens TaxID=67298 RepID=UPI00341663E7
MQHIPFRRYAVPGALLGVLTLSLCCAPGAAAAPVRSGIEADYNGDGYLDLAVGAPNAKVGSRVYAGAVVVFYGSATGVSAGRRTVVHQDSPGVPGSAETDDRFGRSMASADLDGDGYSDLVVGSPGETVGSVPDRGSVTVLWGGRQGIAGGASLPLPSYLDEQSMMGSGVALGDFNGDGRNDVTVTGRTETRTYFGAFTRTGAPARQQTENLGSTTAAVAGDLSGDGTAERLYPRGTTDDPAGVISYIRWTGGSTYATTELTGADGDAAAVGDVNGDGYGDLVVGDPQDPGSDRNGGHKGGQLTVWYGGPTGPAPAQRPTVIHQDTAGVPGSGESADGFGVSVAVGDIDKDGYADVAVGAPNEDLTDSTNAGAVTVLYGSKAGLTTTRARMITQDTAGVPGAPEHYDYFGHALTLRDLTGDGRSDLVVGVPEENSYGMVTVLRGGASGLSTSGVVSITATAAGLTGASQEWFGMVLPDAAR